MGTVASLRSGKLLGVVSFNLVSGSIAIPKPSLNILSLELEFKLADYGDPAATVRSAIEKGDDYCICVLEDEFATHNIFESYYQIITTSAASQLYRCDSCFKLEFPRRCPPAEAPSK